MTRALYAAALRGSRVALCDAAVYPALLGALELPEEAAVRLLRELVTRDFVGLERQARALGLSDSDAALLVDVPQIRGGADVLEVHASGPAADAVTGLRRVLELLP